MPFEGEKVGAGRTATIFRYDEDKVIKLFKASFSKKAIEEEFEIGLYLNHATLNIAKTHKLVERDGKTGIILDFIEGVSMLQQLSNKPWMVFRYAKKMARFHFSIHQAFVRTNTIISSLKDSLSERISRVTVLTSEERTWILSELANLTAGSSICHGDFHPDNIIISKGELFAVDWITARIGNPIADVARTWLLLTMGTLPEDRNRFEVFLAKHLRDLFCRIYMREYKRHSNFSLTEFEKWKMPLAAARLLENVSAKENQNLLAFIRQTLMQVRTSETVA